MNLLPNFLRKIGRPVARRYNSAQSNFHNAGWTGTRVLVVMACLLLTSSLIFNIYMSVTQTSKNFQLYIEEQDKLKAEQERTAKIDKDLSYYQSFEYRQRYGYDSLNLAKPGEKLYLIESSDRQKYDLQGSNPEPVKKEDNWFWWQTLARDVFQL